MHKNIVVLTLSVVFLASFSALEAKKKPVTDQAVTEEIVKLRAQQIELEKKISELDKKRRKADTPAMKQARKEIEKESREERSARKAEHQKLANTQLSGCPADSVWVSGKVAGGSRWRVMSSIRVVNSGAWAIDIESPIHGILVRNLCSGGAVTLSFVMQWEDSDQVQIPLTAIARPPDGGVATDQFSTYLSRWNVQYNRVTAQIWQVHLNRQNQTR